MVFDGIQSHIGSWPEDLSPSVANSQASLNLLLDGPQKVSHNMVAGFYQSKEESNREHAREKSESFCNLITEDYFTHILKVMTYIAFAIFCLLEASHLVKPTIK